MEESSEKKYTTNSWSFDEYTSVTPPAAARSAADVAAAGIEDELHALRKVAEILLLLGEQVRTTNSPLPTLHIIPSKPYLVVNLDRSK